MPPSRPNIVCFVTDQHRADHLGCYGNPDVQTPNIDRLAAEGVRFDESYVANPVCMPNRASLFTGRYPKAHGLRENGIALSRNEEVLPELLRLSGYQTASFGKIHLTPFGLDVEGSLEPWESYETGQYWAEHSDIPRPYYGFEELYLVGGHGSYTFGHYKQELEREFPGMHEKLQVQHALRKPTGARDSWKASIPEELHYNTLIADKTMEFLNARDEERPFFLWCSFPDPHHPFSPPAPYCDQYDPADIAFKPVHRPDELDRLPPYVRECREGRLNTGGLAGDVREVTDDHYREIVAHTYGMLSMVDHNVGRVVKTLEDLSLMEDTIIVFLSDH
ncbi:MAG: sulfatase-like hydrolase/transferase, partial [bacterium]|nr:sulfatase-like hydrolase/transferase [bacterium]